MDLFLHPEENDPNVIFPGSELARELGFYEHLFNGYMYFNPEMPDIISIPLIESLNRNKGNFKNLIKTLQSCFLCVEVICPNGLMQYILKKYGFSGDNNLFSWCKEDIVGWHKGKPILRDSELAKELFPE